jgi:thiol-disulfide isomerase/thioredoxin
MGRSRAFAVAGLVAVIAVGGAAFALDGSDDPVEPAAAAEPTSASSVPVTITVSAPELPDSGLHPALLDIDGWLQSDVTSLEELEGKVVAVQFWTFGCRNCMATLPHLAELYETYRDQGFEIVGIHAPEFGFEAEVANITEAAAELGVTWPIVLDTNKRTFHSW